MAQHSISEDTKAILLLCGILGKDPKAEPLKLNEYNLLVKWLVQCKRRPADLLHETSFFDAEKAIGLSASRLSYLLGRGMQLAFKVEEWERNGLWVISRSDQSYPARYKKLLREKAPSLLFGAGNKALLEGGGLAIVGSRDVDTEGEQFTREVAKFCADQQLTVVSGGARGVDQISMHSALDAGGWVIGIVADSLLKKSISKQAREALAANRLLLLSPYHPDARFTVGSAMGRNKLIYTLADYGLVVRSDYKKGGTWSGAEEVLKNSWVPLFVNTGKNVPKGNEALIRLGAKKWPESHALTSLHEVLEDAGRNTEPYATQKNKSNQTSMFATDVSGPLQKVEERKEVFDIDNAQRASVEPPKTVYEAVLPILLRACVEPKKLEILAEELEVSKSQLRVWLVQAVEQEKLSKLSRPVRYVVEGI